MRMTATVVRQLPEIIDAARFDANQLANRRGDAGLVRVLLAAQWECFGGSR
jgi:hypothetical protein